MSGDNSISKDFVIDFREMVLRQPVPQPAARYVLSRAFAKTPLGQALLSLNQARQQPLTIRIGR